MPIGVDLLGVDVCTLTEADIEEMPGHRLGTDWAPRPPKQHKMPGNSPIFK